MKYLGRSLILGLFVWATLSCGRAWSETLCLDANRQFAYASERLSEKDYGTALIEYKRFIRFFPDDNRIWEAKFNIGMAYLDGGEPQQALPCFDELMNSQESGRWAIESFFMTARCHMRTGNPVLGEICLRNLIAISNDQAVRDRAENAMGWMRLETSQWDKARASFGRISLEGQGQFKVPSILAELELTSNIPYKNPKLAGALSIVPGAGFLYCGRYRDALVAFLLNGGLILAAYESFDHDQNALGGVITFVGFGFYAGNIYGAASSAHKYNRQADRDFISILKDHVSPVLTLIPGPDSRLMPGLALMGRF